MKNRSLFFLIAISLAVMCIFACGCTDQDGSSDNGADSNAGQGGDTGTGDMPAGDGNMTAPDGTGGGPGGQGGMDLASAATTLGVTEDELSAALGMDEEGGQMDLDAAASELGVTVEELQDALGTGDMPEGEMEGGERPEGGGNMTAPDGTPPGETS